MAYNELLAKRIKASFKLLPPTINTHITEKKMFGGLVFLYKGKMIVGIIKEDLMVRVASHKMDHVLQLPHVRPMDFAKRPMKEFVYVSEAGVNLEEQLLYYIELGLEHAQHKLNER